MNNKAYTFKQQVECETNNYSGKHHNYNITQSTASNRRLEKIFEFGINRKLYNKQRLDDDTPNWETKEGTIDNIAEAILNGYGFMTGVLKGNRADQNVVSFGAIALDIDDGLTLEQAKQHPFISKHCGLIYTSASHQKQKKKHGSDTWIEPRDRYRVVFVLPETITDLSLWSYLYQVISEQIPEADPSCKNISRYFYGNTEAEISILDNTKCLPQWVIDEAETLRDMAEAQKNYQPKPKPKSISNLDYADTKELVQQALEYIPQRAPGSGNYKECLQVLMALESEFGNDAIEMAEKWSPSIRGTTWNIPYKIRSFQKTQNNGISIGTLFHIAKQYGFEMPKRSKSTGVGIGTNTFSSSETSKDNSLTIEEAVEKARSILTQGSDEISQNIALESLRLQCGASSGFWNNDIIKPLKRELHKERFRLELKRIKKIDDRIDREYELAKIAPKFQMSVGVLKQALNHLEVDEKTPKAVSMSLDELLNMETEGIDFLIPAWLPKGETIILGGAPKSGKTLLSTDIAFAVATGESKFLGENPIYGKVLIIQSDESPNSCKAKLLKRGFRPQDNENLQLLLNWDISQMSVLEQKLEDFRPDLVIVDSLRRINHGSEISENSAEFADNIYSLKEMFGRYGAAGILIHHTNKDHESMGVGQLRGSSAIAGAAWGIMNLSQIPTKDEETGKWFIKPDDPRRKLELYARDTEGQTANIALNPENNSWELDMTEEQEQAESEAKTLRERILNILYKNPKGLSGSEIVQTLDGGSVSKGSVYTTLNRMVTKKLISTCPARGNHRYSIYFIKGLENDQTNDETNLPPPPPAVPEGDVISESETDTNSGLQTSNTSSNTPECYITPPDLLDEGDKAQKLDSKQDSEADITDNTTSNNIGGGGNTTSTVTQEQNDVGDASGAIPYQAFNVGDRVWLNRYSEWGEVIDVEIGSKTPYKVTSENIHGWLPIASIQAQEISGHHH